MKYIVYLTINNINKKLYIGVHKTKDPNIFDGYIGCGIISTQPSTYMNPHTAFQYAVKKYGPKSFTRTTLFIFDNEEDAYKKESELVNEDFIKQENNYNMIIGGKFTFNNYLPIYLFNKSGELLKKWDTTEEVVKFFNSSNHSFQTALQFKESLYGFFWSRNNTINVDEYSKGDEKQIVYKYSINGKCLESYSSILEASVKENINRATLSTSIRLLSLVNKQFYFSNKLYDEFKPSPKKSLKNSVYYLYTLDGDYILEFKTSKDLLLFFNVKSWNTIYRAIHAQNGIYKTYLIKTEFLGNKIPKGINKSLAKQVNVYDLSGNFIKTCDSVQKAAKEFGAKLSSVNRVLKGLAHTTNHYIFKFKINDIV